MRRLRPLVLLLFVVGILFVATEPESALAHTKVHPGALALVDTARVDDAPTAPSPIVLTVALAVTVLAAVVLLSRRTLVVVPDPGTEVDRPPLDRLARDAFGRRGPPAISL